MHACAVSLDDKYELESGRVYLTGTQALVRLPIIQRRRDRAAGLDTAGFVTGYRGSPLGGIDQAFMQARKFIDAADITFRPGLNEDLAATAILGTQQINLLETGRKQGVFAMWYAKGPGVDRSGDALRHGNLAGSAPKGGVLLLAGDDHTCKSSTTSHQSEFALMDAMIPILHPAGVAEILDFGLYGWALSRYSGCWTALKLVADTVDSSASILVGPDRPQISLPTDPDLPPGGLGIRWPDTPQEQERRLHAYKIPAALAFARANRLDRVVLGGPRRRFGIVTTGKSYLDVRQALHELGLNERRAAELGLAVYKVGLVWPLEPDGLRAFAEGLEEILVVEEKRPLMEGQVKDVLFNAPADRRPRVFGKRDAENRVILPAHDDLTPVQIARAIAARMLPWVDDAGLLARIARLGDIDPGRLAALAPVQRTPYFCSGCPHSSSTRVPEGSRAMAGIGCHWMAQAMDRSTATYTHMGAEGANWIGQAPYVEAKHVFQNLGDGTYFHSGILAIRAAVAAQVRITYKILFNDAVAMTGGQRHDGALTPQRITHQVRAEGVERIAVVSDDIGKYRGTEPFAANVTIHHRSKLDAVQRELREFPGVSVLVYDQTCAAEKRRRRKRGTAAPPVRRVLINELVCEGCGDCSRKSNCLSVVPVETEFGRKRRIDQSSCNEDLSCVAGFCPSFVTVEGAVARPAGGQDPRGQDPSGIASQSPPEPQRPALEVPWNVLVTGVGGTGVVTIGAILAMAAHIEGRGCSTLDMTGMAQKGGPVTTHLRFAAAPNDLHTVRIPARSADLVLGCDIVVAAGREALGVIGRGRTRVILNTAETITGAFIRDPDFRVPRNALENAIRGVAGDERVETVSATERATRLLGDSIATNLFMVGYAYQRGLLPISSDSILKAIALNGAAVAMNQAAFRLGRLVAQEGAAAAAPAGDKRAQAASENGETSLAELVARRAAFLTEYQDARYARRYRESVEQVRRREAEVMGRAGRLTEAVARSLFKLMAYKDEYEVARLHSGEAFRRHLTETSAGSGRIRFHLAPPLLARRDPNTGEPQKITFGNWMLHVFRVLALFRRLRGTAFDPFGYTAERRTERALVDEYRGLVERLLSSLTPARHETAVAIAAAAEDIRGFGHIKDANLAAVRERWRQLEKRLDPVPAALAAE
jgi:indolepyruvate ferredoxin oxidoreductase